jgi:hypothetical protein
LALVGWQAVDVSLNGEQGVDPADGFERQRRDCRGCLALRSSSRGDSQIGQFEELASGMSPASGFQDLPRPIELAVAPIRIGLQDAAPALEMALGMLTGAVAGVEEQGCRRGGSSKRPIITHVRPAPGDIRLALRQDRHGGVVAMQARACQNMGLDALIDRLQHG